MGNETTRLQFTDQGDRCWAIANASGAAEFRVITSTDQPVAITLHSPHQISGIKPGPCNLVKGGQCYADATFAGGRDLYRAWVDEGRDDEVIWGALESWHADRLGTSGETRTGNCPAC